jgi:hypothetical protein
MTVTYIEQPTRLLTVTEKLPPEKTGFKASVFLHVDHTREGEIIGLRCSEKGKDGSTLDKLLTAIGDSATAILKQAQRPPHTDREPPE